MVFDRCEVMDVVETFCKENNLKYKTGKCGRKGERGREGISKEYTDILKSSKIIVTSHPSGWEGDYRTSESLVSGALVLRNKMYNPEPFIVNETLYSTSDELINLLEKFTNDLEYSKIIQKKQIPLNTKWLFNYVESIVFNTKNINCVYKWSFIKPDTPLKGELKNIVVEGLKEQNKLTNNHYDADIILIDSHRTKKNEQSTIDELKKLNLSSKKKIIVFDWSDRYDVIHKDLLDYTDFYFKRSLVNRKKGIFTDLNKYENKHKIYSLFYVLKPKFEKVFENVEKLENRDLDVICLFQKK